MCVDAIFFAHASLSLRAHAVRRAVRRVRGKTQGATARQPHSAETGFKLQEVHTLTALVSQLL